MFSQLKNKLDNELAGFLRDINKHYHLRDISPLLFDSIKEYASRDGKRIRPILFVTGYLGFAPRPVPGLYRSALAIEILHDFLLIHDDIIDKSKLRRGKPAMHTMLNTHLKKYPNVKFSGEDLAIVVGDVMYAMAIESFLAIKENPTRKESALRKFVEAAFYTGCGEFVETLYGAGDISRIKLGDIYNIYDYKTAYYTFSCPLTTGAILAGASKNETEKLFRFGICLGRAFQIKDDILGLFADEKKTGKSALSDLQEAKKTLILWHVYQNLRAGDKTTANRILAKNNITFSDLKTMRELAIKTGSLDYAKKQIARLLTEALELIGSSRIKQSRKTMLVNYAKDLLKI